MLRLFSSLFNLQGTSRSQSAELYYSKLCSSCQVLFSFESELSSATRLPRELIYISTPSSFCQHLFSNIFQNQLIYSISDRRLSSAQLIYQNIPPLSTPFFNFFRFFLKYFNIAFQDCVCYPFHNNIMYITQERNTIHDS